MPLLLTALVTTGCVLDRTGQSSTEALRREVAMHGTEIDSLETHFETTTKQVSALEDYNKSRSDNEILKMETMEEVRSEVAKLRGDLETLQHDYQAGAATTEDARYRLDWLETRADALEKAMGVATPPPPVHTDPNAGPTTVDGAPVDGTAPADGTPVVSAEVEAATTEAAGVSDPAALISLAEGHLAAGREAAAEVVLKRFLDLYPKDDHVPEVTYRYAEAAFNDARYKEAVTRFQDVIDKYKTSGWAPWAMLRQGECFEQLGQKDNAKLFYEDVLRLYPKSKAAKDAKLKLGK